MKTRNQPPLVRQWILLKTLCSRGMGATVRQLAEEMGVSEKTIRRDLSAFLEAGLPIQDTTGENGTKWWRLDPEAARADLSFTYDEALALYLGRRYLAPLSGTHLWTAAQRALQKVRASLGENALNYLNRIGDAFHDSTFGITDYGSKGEIIDRLMIGIEDHRVVFITYRSARATEPVTYDIHPYRFTLHKGSLYLQGYKPDDESIRTWKVNRIEQAEVDQMPFTIPDALDLDQELASSFGIYHSDAESVNVKLRFSHSVARYVSEYRWHPSQQAMPQDDGSLIVEYQLAGTEELKSWLLGFGRHAEVLEPAELRNDVINEIRAMRLRYAEQKRVSGVSVKKPSTT